MILLSCRSSLLVLLTFSVFLSIPYALLHGFSEHHDKHKDYNPFFLSGNLNSLETDGAETFFWAHVKSCLS